MTNDQLLTILRMAKWSISGGFFSFILASLAMTLLAPKVPEDAMGQVYKMNMNGTFFYLNWWEEALRFGIVGATLIMVACGFWARARLRKRGMKID